MRGKVELTMTDEQLSELCERLGTLPREDRTGPKVRALLADEYDITIGLNAAYTLLNGPFAEHLKRIRARKERIDMLRKAREEAPDMDESYLADDSAAQLSFLINDYIATKGDALNPASTDDDDEELKRLAMLQKLVEQVSTIRKDDRELRKELRAIQQREKDTIADLKDNTLTEEQRAARMRARFGV